MRRFRYTLLAETGQQQIMVLIEIRNPHLLKLANQTDLGVADDVVFLSEGKEPGRRRGIFFTVVGLLGLIEVLIYKNKDST